VGLNFKEICDIISPRISKIPTTWDGKKSILEMKAEGGRWKDMEWIGFYFELLCKKNLSGVVEMPYSKKYGNVSFDGFLECPWDFKAHAIQSKEDIIINDSEAISNAVKDFGYMGLIIVTGTVVYDNESEDFKKWHDDLKGKKSKYELDRIARGVPPRRRKISMKISKILFIKIDDELLIKTGSFQKNFRNQNGSARREKVSLNPKEAEKNAQFVLEINETVSMKESFMIVIKLLFYKIIGTLKK